MSYQSLTFIIFCAAVVFLYYLVGGKRRLWVLAAANLAFYAIAGVKYLPFILVTTVVTFFCGRVMGRIYDKADEEILALDDSARKKEIRQKAKKRAKKSLVLSLTVSIMLLAVCKYTPFIVTNVNRLGIWQIEAFNMILPLGISFYTFMALSYVLDVYWKRYKAENNFLVYAVFLSYFPHVVQGPIDRFNEWKEQVREPIKFDFKNLSFGMQLTVWGFFKKLVIADRLGIFVNEVVDNWEKYDGVILMIAFAVYSIQLYADFSGCIDIITGVSEMFGIKLRKNFERPYFSRTMGEFWRRWHISLQEWFKDYLYYPVTTSNFVRKTKKKLKAVNARRAQELFASCFPILAVWLVTGIWHGAAWKYVAWGLFHACLLIGSQVFDPLFKKLTKVFHVDTENFGWHFWQMLRTFSLCCAGRIFFRSNGLMNALKIIKKMALHFNWTALLTFDPTDFGFAVKELIVIAMALLALLVVSILQERGNGSVREILSRQNIIFRWIVVFICLFSVIMFGLYGPGYNANSFIYEQF